MTIQFKYGFTHYYIDYGCILFKMGHNNSYAHKRYISLDFILKYCGDQNFQLYMNLNLIYIL